VSGETTLKAKGVTITVGPTGEEQIGSFANATLQNDEEWRYAVSVACYVDRDVLDAPSFEQLAESLLPIFTDIAARFPVTFELEVGPEKET
jgi:hypothetical protein